MNRIPVVFVAVLVLLAGCSSIFPGPSTPTDTSTPTPTPDQSFPPGITSEGIVNPVALQSAHQSALLADGFIVNVTYENVANGTVQWRTTQHRIAGPGGERALQRSAAGDPGTLVTAHDVWSNTTHTTMRSREGNDTRYTVRDRRTLPESLVWPGQVIRTLQDNADAFEVSSVDHRDGTQFVTLNATIERAGGEGSADTTATLVVDERGVIHSLETTTNYGGDDWRVTYTVERVGGVTPDQPSWLDDVPPSASLVVNLFTDMGPDGVIQLEHTGGDAVRAGTFVTVLGNDTLYEAQLAEPLQPGEILYVYIAADTGQLMLTTSEPTADEYEPVPQEFTVQVVTPDGVVVHDESLGWG